MRGTVFREESEVGQWEIQYRGHTIRVEDSARRERLFVDDELQDEFFGFGFRSRLYGTICDEHGECKALRVALGGYWSRICRVFVDNRLVFHSKPDAVAREAMVRNRKE